MDDVQSLVKSLGSSDVAQRREAAQRLAQLEDAAQTAATALVEACDEADEDTREWVVAALEALGRPPESQQPRLIEQLGHPCALARYWAATLLGRLEDRAGENAVRQLAASLEADDDVAVRQRAAWALGKVGPAAAAARDALTKAAASSDSRLARLAAQALANLG
jgi:HEAT repeat protein